MKRWFDSLFARVLLVQGLVALMAMLLVGVFAVRQQSVALAKAIAPLWATALLPSATAASATPPASTLPRSERVTTTVQLLAGPPPADAVTTGWYPRFHALAAELRAVGVPVVSMRVSGTTGAAVTWLELERGSQRSWVGMRGELEGADLRERAYGAFLAGALGTLLAASLLSRRLVRPLTELRLSMRRRNVQVADRLLGSFIEMARAEDEPLHDRVDLAELLRQVLADDERFLAQAPDDPVWVQPATALGLERAVRNLLDNACNHGAGIAAAERENMVKPFVRGETSRLRLGTGLGLAILQRTVHRHHGKLILDDAAPGLRVRIELPTAEPGGIPPPARDMG